ncbi:MaoC/PaaZ C-terminal domain-containing protein [Janibacter indicus]|uniref:MaoC/PaaZ C-terminal domain-containing protein n=1 Tax=Janibacter indicus TaxID=857417 RepID=UPI003D9A839C
MRGATTPKGEREGSTAEVSAGVFAEDLAVGTVLQLGTYPMTQDAIVEFAEQWDPQFFHADPERAAAEGALGGLLASGLHTIAIYHRLTILARTEPWHVIAGTGLDDVRLPAPVRPGDVLTGTTTVTRQELDPQRGRGLITFAGCLVNQADRTVLTLVMSAFLTMRSG